MGCHATYLSDSSSAQCRSRRVESGVTDITYEAAIIDVGIRLADVLVINKHQTNLVWQNTHQTNLVWQITFNVHSHSGASQQAPTRRCYPAAVTFEASAGNISLRIAGTRVVQGSQPYLGQRSFTSKKRMERCIVTGDTCDISSKIGQ